MQQKQNKNIDELVATINDNPDNLHIDVTPSVHKLAELGLPALRAILPLLDSMDMVERLRAHRVLLGVISRRFGWRPGQGYADQRSEQDVKELLEQNGNYKPNALPKARKAAVNKWEQWLLKNKDDE